MLKPIFILSIVKLLKFDSFKNFVSKFSNIIENGICSGCDINCEITINKLSN